ncbi:MAG: DUF3604 domain-containing protein, partial [Candidatus Electrothrix sp. ATG2]|nr:DUF3604 domain-containing protein [Candidatus Electrothrix sp. ATG2]
MKKVTDIQLKKQPSTISFFIISCLMYFTNQSAAAPLNIYFGDIHGHSTFSDGCGDPYDYYQNAINNELDFAALTDHGEQLSYEEWEAIKNLTATYNSPGNFVTFFGYEWTHSKYGHKVVLFRRIPIGFYPSLLKSSGQTPKDLWSSLNRLGFYDKAITIPHHPAGGPVTTSWNYHDDNYQPIVELVSKHGNSEFSVNDYTIPDSERFEQIDYYFKNNGRDHSVKYAHRILGYKLGVIGGTDTHDADPGSVYSDEICQSLHTYQGGLTAVLAEKLSKEHIWHALKARRVYATSGPKILLHFRIGESLMGETVEVTGAPKLSIKAVAPAGYTIDKIVIEKNSRTVQKITGDALKDGTTSWRDLKFSDD